jgi:hypothetical protein
MTLEKEELTQLRKENKRLRMGRDILKTTALFSGVVPGKVQTTAGATVSTRMEGQASAG